jgi:hypothetical protein
MAHTVHGGVDSSGELPVIESQIAAVRIAWNNWGEAMALHTNHDADYWLNEMPGKKRELWLTAKQMVQKQHGIIDDIWPISKGETE